MGQLAQITTLNLSTEKKSHSFSLSLSSQLFVYSTFQYPAASRDDRPVITLGKCWKTLLTNEIHLAAGRLASCRHRGRSHTPELRKEAAFQFNLKRKCSFHQKTISHHSYIP